MRKLITILAFVAFLVPALSRAQTTVLKKTTILKKTTVIATSVTAPTLTFVQGNGTSLGGTGLSTCTVTLTGVAATDAIELGTQWTNVGITATVSDGTSSFTASAEGAVTDGATDYGETFRLLSSVASGSVTYTVTYTPSGSTSYAECAVMEFHRTSGSWSYSSGQSNGAGATSSTANDSGAITTTGPAAVAFFSKLSTTAATTSNPLINGITPTEPSYSPLSTYDHNYYYLPTSGFTNGHCVSTYSTGTSWVSECLALQ